MNLLYILAALVMLGVMVMVHEAGHFFAARLTGIPVKVEQRLIEQNFGKYESTPRNGAEFQEAKKLMASRYGNGESMLHLAQRIYNLLDEIKAGDQEYILVAHNGIARIVESYFRDMTNEEFSAFGIKNCEVKRYEFD